MENQVDNSLLRMNQTLKLLATENSLSTILDDVINAVESQIDHAWGSIFILDRASQKLFFEAGPNLPDEIRDSTREFEVDLKACACGKTALINEPVIVPDLEANPCCASFNHVAKHCHLYSAWSIPIRNIEGKVLGTFCLYSKKYGRPTEDEMILMQSFANIAGIAIQNKRTEEKLRVNEKRFKQLFKHIYSIMGDTSCFTGSKYIHELVRSLATTLNVEIAIVGELIDGEQPSIKTSVFWQKDHFEKNMEYKVAGTPCEKVMRGQNAILYKNKVQRLFPKDKDLEAHNIESYGAVCLNDENKESFGILAVMDTKPMDNPEYIHIILSVFASKVKAELCRIQIEKEMVQAKQEAEKSNEAKSEFLARMSHELRTPLNAILGFTQLMQMENNVPELQGKNLLQISKAGEHLLALINEVLDLSKIDSGNMSYSLENIAIGCFLSDMASLFTPLAQERGIKIKICGDLENKEGYLIADRMRFKQVLMNLISNAIKYNRKGGEVFLDWQEIQNSKMRILVNDTGAGIEPEKLKKAFQPFERLGHEFSVVQGAGIGLTIAQKLVAQMDGELSVNSIPGEGSSFFVDLPKGKKKQVWSNYLKEKNYSGPVSI